MTSSSSTTQTNSSATAIQTGTYPAATLSGTNPAVTAVDALGGTAQTWLLGTNALDYATATTASTTAGSTVNLFDAANLATVHFLPVNGVLTAGTTGEFNPLNTTASGYSNAAAWTGTPKLAGNASSFTLTDTADGGKTATLSENISGSPFSNGNGSVNESLVFTGNNSDTVVIKHAVALANVPAITNNNSGVALDVKNETYAETYAKAGVTSNYNTTQTHKFSEANGSQALNNAFAENYAYKDAGLTINSVVKTALADVSYLNGAEKIAANNAANYHYAGTAGTADYIVTDTRNLVQSDERTFTNTTVTNLAKYSVTDLTTATNPLKIDASGVITGTTTNLSTLAKPAASTTFVATAPKFTVSNNNYSLDVKDFSTAGAGNENALLSLVNGQGSGNVFDSLLGSKNVPATLASAKYFDLVDPTLFKGTQFADAITVKDTAAAPFNANINAGAGNDTITGGFGDDTLTGGAGADTFKVTAGKDVVTDFALGTDTLTVAKGTGTAKVTVNFADGSPAVEYIVTGNATTDVTIPATAKTAADLTGITGVSVDNPFDFSASTIAQTTAGSAASDSIIGGAGADTLNGGLGFDTIIGGEGADVLNAGRDGGIVNLKENTAATDTVVLDQAKMNSNANSNGNVSIINNFDSSATADRIDVGFKLVHGTSSVAANTVTQGTTATTTALPVTVIADNGTVGIVTAAGATPAAITAATAAANTNLEIFNLTGANDKLLPVGGATAVTSDTAVASAVAALTSGSDFASAGVAAKDSFVLQMNDGANTYLFHYTADADFKVTTASDVELIGVLNGVGGTQVISFI
ncbi:MAG: hypothetical protein PHD53_08280 [Methylococcales bacterium]|nr:hypothetical protein [Methylococcales bacterium]